MEKTELSDEFVLELKRLEASLKGVFMGNPAQPPAWKTAKIKPGETRMFPNELPGWRFQHWTKEQMKKANTPCPYFVYLSPGEARKLKESCAGREFQVPLEPKFPGLDYLHGPEAKEETDKSLDAVAALLKPIKLKNFPRRRFMTFQEAWDYAQSLSPYRLKTRLGIIEISPEDMEELYAAYLVREQLPNGRKIKLVKAVIEEDRRIKKYDLSCRELASRFGKATLDDKFDINHELRHLQFSDSFQRQKARVLIEFAEFGEHNSPDDVTEDIANRYVGYLMKKRADENPNGKGLSEETAIKNLNSVSALYGYGKDRHYCDSNPFIYLTARLRRNMPHKDLRKPHTVEQIIHLIRVTWETDKIICLAVILTLRCGVRRCELLRLLCSSINMELNALDVPKGEGGKRKKIKPRRIPFDSGTKAWFKLFNIDPKSAKKLINLTEYEYEKRLKAARELAGLPEWGKDGIRKDFSIMTQWKGMTLEERQEVLGHVLGVLTTERHYDGDATSEWAAAIDNIEPVAVFGYHPTPCNLDELV